MALSAGETGHLADHEETPLYKKHGSDNTAARPTLGSNSTAAPVCLWDGTVAPDNGLTADFWWDDTNDQWKRYDGSSWVSASGTYSPPKSDTSGVPFSAAAGNYTVGPGNSGRYARVRGTGPISSVRIRVGTSSGNISVGVYSNTGAGESSRPGTRKATSGAVACPATGTQDVALTGSVAVQDGDWIGVTADNNTATFLALPLTSADMGEGTVAYLASHPAPADASAATTGDRMPFVVGIA